MAGLHGPRKGQEDTGERRSRDRCHGCARFHRKRKTVIEKGEYAHYAPGGRIVYSQNGVLLAVPFDERKMEVTGPADPVLDGVQYRPSSYAQFAIAQDGTLAYIPGAATDLNNTLVTIDRGGREEALKAPPGGFEDMDLSDRKSVV